MGLFDKIRDNARDLSMKAIEATREYDEDYLSKRQPAAVEPPVEPAPETSQEPEPAETDTSEDESQFLTDEPIEAPAPETEASKKPEKPEGAEEKTEPAKPARLSKVTEISKTDYEQSQKEKKREEAKQAAKERLAKSYTPSYKPIKSSSKIKVTDHDVEQDKSEETPAAKLQKPVKTKPVGIVDITPKKLPDPLKGAIYARERAALSALASQRKLNGTVPLYVAQHMNFKTCVFINRIEYSGSFGKNTLPINQVAWVKLRHGGTGVIIETTEGKRVVMVVKPADRLAFADAVIKVQAMQPKKGKFRDTQTVRIDQLERFSEGVDELEKLAKLYDKGIISKDEFDAKKKQILGI